MSTDRHYDYRDRDVLVTKEAADYLRVHPQTLYRWRAEGKGPPFKYLGTRVVYLKSALIDWVRGSDNVD